jgi:hypothetical protein
VGESGRSSATLGTSSVEEWLQQAARESENDGDSPASRLQFQLIQGESVCSACWKTLPDDDSSAMYCDYYQHKPLTVLMCLTLHGHEMRERWPTS